MFVLAFYRLKDKMNSFRFEIQDVEEARCNDPHHHHLTHLFGRIQAGKIHLGQRISIPSASGVFLFSSIGQIFEFGVPMKSFVEVAADQATQTLDLVIRAPSIPKEIVQLGLATQYEPLQSPSIGQILLRQPETFLHSNGYSRLCAECAQFIPRNPENLKIILQLTTHTNTGVAERAIWYLKMLTRWKEIEEQTRTNHLLPTKNGGNFGIDRSILLVRLMT